MKPRSLPRKPFWLPTINYYILSTAVAIIIFFVVWGVLHDEFQETPWIPAGIVSGGILIIAVVIRETILKKSYYNYLIKQQNYQHIVNQAKKLHKTNETKKLTLDKNTNIIKEIEKKSEAAKVLGTLSEPHREVFELCDRYLEISQKELGTVGVGSPRLVALKKGRDRIKKLHKFHLLSWAATESHLFTQESQSRVSMTEKMEFAHKSLGVLESALQYYPNETQLIDSGLAIKEYIVSIQVKHLIEKAEKAAFKENIPRAINYYRDALFYLARENNRTEERERVAEKINTEIDRLQKSNFAPNKGEIES
jgi:hypothetical protein